MQQHTYNEDLTAMETMELTHEEFVQQAEEVNGIFWLKANGKNVRVTSPKNHITYGLRGDADGSISTFVPYPLYSVNVVRHGAGNGDAFLCGYGGGHVIRAGPGSGKAIHASQGEGDAIRLQYKQQDPSSFASCYGIHDNQCVEKAHGEAFDFHMPLTEFQRGMIEMRIGSFPATEILSQ